MNPAMLIIDDDPSFNAILVRTLERRGHPACGALDPQAAGGRPKGPRSANPTPVGGI